MSPYPAVVFLLLTLAQPTRPATRAAQAYRGTVQAIQTHPAGLDLITGVGFAFRLVHLRTLPTTALQVGGACSKTDHLARPAPPPITAAPCQDRT